MPSTYLQLPVFASYIIANAMLKFHDKTTNLAKFFSPLKVQIPDDLKAADEVTNVVAKLIIKEVESFCSKTTLTKPSVAGTQTALESIRKLMPTENLLTVADVINAGWTLRFDLDGWDVPGVLEERKIAVINDLVFKSFEVYEWSRTNGPK